MKVKDDVYYNAFYRMYWVMSHSVAIDNVESLLKLLQETNCEKDSNTEVVVLLERPC